MTIPSAPALEPDPAPGGLTPNPKVLTPPAPAVEPMTPPSATPLPPPAVGTSDVRPSAPTVGGTTPPPAPPAARVPDTRPLTQPIVQTGAVISPTKFRILLRVGEGQPTFEVKCGDDLVLKVACEKVDIVSPEQGDGPSSVKARGKVKFIGFGAEGTCDELSFLAGTGEVSMTGKVKIAVKDKLGRVESELETNTLTYRIDPDATITKP
jgi:hypothetical protein